MNPYETIFIIKPSLTDEEIAKVIEKTKGIIQRGGGEVVVAENWGKKKLAYEVRKEKKGTYIIVHFKGTGATVSELERSYRLDETIIKFITLKIEADKLGKTLPARDEKPVSFRDREAMGER
ncbi:MAG TPA: 30S ribosomal protein S6 [Candidatus Manganitrophaceae bacterium]|nr:30S ribosomal protein S6 [Candidatus Manganitrophaceae bacterium]